MISASENKKPSTAPGNGKVGAVLVVGGGIAGMQSALDCADAGFKVYLLEQKPAIGGNMAALDKTFPTNDCAMCMISPKLVETGRHLNIEILSYSDLIGVAGEAGDFKITVKRKARYVNEKLCNGCGDCEKECPVNIPDAFNGTLADRKAIYRLYPQAIPNVFTVDKRGLPPPCRGSCPAGVNAQGYVGLIAKGKFLESLDLVRERMPFAGTCGRICHHPCEQKCNRKDVDEAVSVRNLKRFVADYERELVRTGRTIKRQASAIPIEQPTPYAEKVAIIGGGPAGLTCANDLAKRGYQPTVFDSNEELGGMMRTGIPEYRLPRDFLDHEINLVLDRGISARMPATLGKDFTIADLRRDGYQAFFIATGAQLAKKIPLEGSEAGGVHYGIPFLREVNAGGRPNLGNSVIVIGGGNVATDVARCTRRLVGDGKVALYCLESRAQMPAHEWEIRESEEEKVIINPSWGPRRIVAKDGVVQGVEFVKCASVFDENGKFNPKFDETRKTFEAAASVILAVGQNCDLSFLDDGVKTERGLIKTDRLTLETTKEGVFAGGDNVLGPSSLVQAVEQGHRAAESIHRYLRKLDMRSEREPVERPSELADIPAYADRAKKARRAAKVAVPLERTRSFLEIERAFTEEEAVDEAKRCLNCGGCCECFECVRVCKALAIDHKMKDRVLDLNVGAIIMANGYEPFDAALKSEFAFGRAANVMTSLQFERILSASGPYKGHLRRPSDGKVPRKIAWIQCVGSRDVTVGKDYCSSVCCMYATKEAVIAKEHESAVEPTIFFTDLRAFGKGFEEFCNRAKDKTGVRYVRSQISSIKENPANKNLIVRYYGEAPDGRIKEEEFDIVVLSVGLVAGRSADRLAVMTGIERNRFGFAVGRPSNLSRSSRDGVFLTGAASGPRDIPETVTQSSAAASLCGEFLAPVRGTLAARKQYPPEKDISNERPRIGIFVCHCGTNIASVVDVKAVAEYAGTLGDVIHAESPLYTCSQDTQERMKDIIREKNLNRVIVASCTPRTHEPLFRETLREAGLNQYMFEMVNIREQCSWVHQNDHAAASAKAKALVAGGIGKARLLEPLRLSSVNVTKSALVIGGGISGITAALSLARQEFDVHLVEREKELGGNLRHIRRSLEGHDWREHLARAVSDVTSHPRVKVYLNSEIAEVGGFVGNFTTRLEGRPDTIQHGIVVVATGADEWRPDVFLYGANANVITQRELESRLESGFAAETVVMIQCVGSRNAEREYCSRTCCGEAVKNALDIKTKNPGAKVYILYRDIRTYEYKELYYREAREKGIVFIRFPDTRYPTVSAKDGKLEIAVHDAALGEEVNLRADVVALSAATVPYKESNRRLGELLKAPLDKDGFFMEAHVKLRPVDFANAGMFVCGLAHSPKYTEENISEALAAAGRAACILGKDSLEVGGLVSTVNQDKCASCLTCVRECVYNAPFINAQGRAEIEAVKCMGCGNCAAACPAKAIQLSTFTDAQVEALFRDILGETREETLEVSEHAMAKRE